MHPLQVALRYFQRLLQSGVGGAEVWNNLGLCCFHGGQYDMALGCMDRALTAAGDDVIGDVWYNIAQVSRLKCGAAAAAGFKAST